jgi:hypothetical protein
VGSTGTASVSPVGPQSKRDVRRDIRQGSRQREADAAALKKEREDKLNLMNNEIKGFNDEIKKYTDIQNSRIYSRASDEQKKSYQKIIDDNKVKIQNKQAEIDKLKKTPLGTPTSTSPTATTTNTATPTPKSAEDRAAIDAGGGL